jgi:hypothetical protein
MSENGEMHVQRQSQQSPVLLLSDGFDGDGDEKEPAFLVGLRLSVADRCRHTTFANSRRQSPTADEIFAFLGVPFAEAPERFARPRPLGKLWTGVRQATQFGMSVELAHLTFECRRLFAHPS